MARKKNVNITTDDVLWGVGGAAVALAGNALINQAVQTMPEQSRTTIGQVVPFGKIVGGAWAATNKNVGRNWRFFGLGMAGAGAIEAGFKFMPQYFSISGIEQGDLYSLIGNSQVLNLPVNASGSMEEKEQSDFFTEEAVLGVKSQVPVL